jgi:hypothetical protein
VFRTDVDPHTIGLSMDSNDRPYGSLFGRRPDPTSATVRALHFGGPDQQGRAVRQRPGRGRDHRLLGKRHELAPPD